MRVGDHPYRFMDVKFDKTNPPGSMHELLRKKSVSPEITWGDSYSADNMLAAFQHRDERLGLMEEQGIETAILLPTFGGKRGTDDGRRRRSDLRQPPCVQPLAGRGMGICPRWPDHRSTACCLCSTSIRAVAELDRVLSLGARLIHLRPGPTGSGRSPADPYYDPFWARLNEARVPVAFHINDYRYPEVSLAWGEDPDPPVREMSAFQWAFVHGDRPIMETFGALIYGNLFGRFPNLYALSIENGSDWVSLLAHPARQEEGNGPVRAMGRWSSDRAPERHVPGSLLRVAVPRGRRGGADRLHRCVPGALRFGLPSSRGTRPARRFCRTHGEPERRRDSSGHAGQRRTAIRVIRRPPGEVQRTRCTQWATAHPEWRSLTSEVT